MGLTRALTRGLTVPLTTRLDVRPGFSSALSAYAVQQRDGAYILDRAGNNVLNEPR